MKYTQIPTTTFQNIQLNAGILVDTFSPSTGVVGEIIGATSGGINFTASAEFTDFGEDIDNAPRNTKELKKSSGWNTVTMSGTFVTISVSTARMLVGMGDIDSSDGTKITPRDDIKDSDFRDIWWIGDYSEYNGEKNAGFCAIHLINGLSTGGFQIQSGDRAKGTFAFEFTGHYSIQDQTKVPFEIYVKSGSEED